MKFIDSIWQKFINMKYKVWHFPVFLLGVMLIAYALFIAQLGFYWDDWAQLLVSRLYGSQGYWSYFALDRPTSAWTHVLLVPLLGFKPIHWQIFTLLMRWLTVIGMWYSLQLIWPNYKRTITVSAFLFAVYPAFVQQAPSVSFHQHWLQFALYFSSLICMITSIRSGKLKWGWMFGALILQALQLSITEFFAGIELIRPVILWIILSQESVKGKRFVKTVLYWMPYIILLAGFTIWRLFLSNIEKNEPSLIYAFLSNPLDTLFNLFHLIITDQVYIVISSWGRVFDINLSAYSEILILGSWIAALLVALGLWLYFAGLAANEADDQQSRSQMLWLGALVTLVGPAPIWLAGKNMLVENDFHVDRFAMASMWGISLFIVVLLEYIMHDWKKTALATAMLIAMATGLHIRVASEYRQIWQNQEEFYWQLLWRAPYIEPGTALVSVDTVLAHQELFSTAAAVNHLYPQSERDGKLAYWMYRLTPTFDTILADDNPTLSTNHRIYQFRGTLDNSLVIQYDPQISPCLWVLSSMDADNPDIPAILQQAAVHSNLSRIDIQPVDEPGYPPVEMIGNEPVHEWCYIYQKAELAAQEKDWQTVLNFFATADMSGFQPGDGFTHPREWLPIIRALIEEGQLEQAEEFSQTLINENVHYRTMVCALWMETAEPVLNGPDAALWQDAFHCVSK